MIQLLSHGYIHNVYQKRERDVPSQEATAKTDLLLPDQAAQLLQHSHQKFSLYSYTCMCTVVYEAALHHNALNPLKLVDMTGQHTRTCNSTPISGQLTHTGCKPCLCLYQSLFVSCVRSNNPLSLHVPVHPIVYTVTHRHLLESKRETQNCWVRFRTYGGLSLVVAKQVSVKGAYEDHAYHG